MASKVCSVMPCACAEIEDAVDWLLAHPQSDISTTYLTLRSCWPIMDALRRRVLATAAAERKRCAKYLRVCSCRACKDLADELERPE